MIVASEPTKEYINIDIKFSSEYWNNPPMIIVLIDNVEYACGIVEKDGLHISINHMCDFDKWHTLKIIRSGKTDQETRFINNQFETQTLFIDTVTIDNTNIRDLIWSRSNFEPDYPEPWASEQIANGATLESNIVGETTLGHNGVWTFEWRSPFYMFLVDAIRGKV